MHETLPQSYMYMYIVHTLYTVDVHISMISPHIHEHVDIHVHVYLHSFMLYSSVAEKGYECGKGLTFALGILCFLIQATCTCTLLVA